MLVYGAEPTSCFGLMGTSENAGTLALGWCLGRSPALRQAFGTALAVTVPAAQDWAISCQSFGDDKGFTDLEATCGSDLHLIVEAKVGWFLPSAAQLARYRPRFERSPAKKKIMVTVSATSRAWAERHGPQDVDGVPMRHLAWVDVQRIAATARKKTRSPLERLWLDELVRHLEDYGMARNRYDARVYVLSLNRSRIHADDPLTWIDVVVAQRRYFHPFGKNWPATPPSYLGFRYHAAFRAVHYVEKAEIVERLDAVDPRWPHGEGPHVVYTLGPPMQPAIPLPLGVIQNNARHDIAIDLLLSGQCKTYADAIKAMAKRSEQGLG